MKVTTNGKTFEVSTVKAFLEQCAEAWKGINLTPVFVLEHGMQWTTMAPKQPKRGVLRGCYMNAANLALARKDVIYVEGYAAGIIPVMHAWCVDAQGQVLEPTWPPALWKGADYFGIPFSREFLKQRLMTQEYYGLLDNPTEGWPVQTSPRGVWIHPNYKEKGTQCRKDPESSTPSAKNS